MGAENGNGGGSKTGLAKQKSSFLNQKITHIFFYCHLIYFSLNLNLKKS